MRVPWTSRRSKQSILKEISPGCSLEEMMLKLELQYFAHLMRRVDSLEEKSRDITLPTKVCLVKAMVSPVVMYGCESWTVKKAECRRIEAFELWCREDS